MKHQGVSTVMRTGASLVLALLLHALVYLSLNRLPLTAGEPPSERRVLTVQLGPESKPPESAPAPAPAPPSTPPLVRKPATPERSRRPRPAAPAPAPPEPPAEPRPLQLDPPKDLSAMIAAARQRREAAAPPAEEKAAQPEQGNDIALENIRRSVRQARGRDGVNGLFQILSMGPRVGRFSFRGWHNDASRQWNQVIEVDAGPSGDVERAIVRRMIELIRQHHNGDFQWDSRRLGRVVTLSARAQDSAGLEDFLLHEFFGTERPDR